MGEGFTLREFLNGKMVNEQHFRAPSLNSAKAKARKLIQSLTTDCWVFSGGKARLHKIGGRDARFKPC